jgi:hypothetical protein
VVDNVDIESVAETQRVRVRLPWDDQKMRQTMAAAYGVDRLGKTMAAAYGLDRLGKTMAAAYGLDRLGKTMAAAQRQRMRPLFHTSKLVGPMFGGELQRSVQAMLNAYRPRMPLLLDTQKLVGRMFGGEFERIVQAMAGAYRAPVRPRFDFQGVVEVAQGLADATIAVPSTATTGNLAVLDGSVPAPAPLFPGLMDPWEQIRSWDLQAWITFLAFLVAVAGLLVAMGQSRPQGGLSPKDLRR